MSKRKNEGEIDMTALSNKAGNEINKMAAILANYPSPDRWTPEMKAQTVQFAALLDTAQKMILAANLIGINYEAEKQTFLDNAGHTKSVFTSNTYNYSLGRLEAWADRQKINLLELTPAQADDFIYYLRGERSSGSVRLDVAAASSFFTFLHRRHKAIDNPFRGTRARPPSEAPKKPEIPSTEEVEIMIRELSPDLAAAVAIMALRGLRAGILSCISITGDKFSGRSKGKEVSGALPAKVIEAIKAAKLPLRRPFAEVLTNTLEKRIARAIEKLHKAGKVQARYSAHDFRHSYAVTEYRKDKDIYRVSKLLGHASIQVTEIYLRGLGEVE